MTYRKEANVPVIYDPNIVKRVVNALDPKKHRAQKQLCELLQATQSTETQMIIIRKLDPDNTMSRCELVTLTIEETVADNVARYAFLKLRECSSWLEKRMTYEYIANKRTVDDLVRKLARQYAEELRNVLPFTPREKSK